jgi:hypothetical protein
MSEGQELETIRREIAELRAGLEALQLQKAPPTDLVEDTVNQFKKTLAQDGKTTGIGVFRVIMIFNEQSHNVASYFHTFGNLSKLPSEQKLSDTIAAFSNALALRAMRHLAVRFLEGKPMEVTPAEWASALGVGEEELQVALAPLLAQDVLKRIITGSGEHYVWEDPNTFMTLLALA